MADIIEKIETKHGAQQDEVREILASNPRFRFVEKGHRRGEDIYSASGQIESGRHLIVFFILKPGGQALIVSARDMDPRERTAYEKK